MLLVMDWPNDFFNDFFNNNHFFDFVDVAMLPVMLPAFGHEYPTF